MKKVMLGATAFAVVAATVIWFAQQSAPPPQVVGDYPPAILEHRQADHATPVQAKDKRLQYDPDRLYEKGYENDADIQALARLTSLPARCVIEGLKEFEAQIPMSDDCLEARRKNEVQPVEPYQVSVIFRSYSNEELNQLSVSEPDAAILLARRLDEPSEFSGYYQHAIELLEIEKRDVDARAVRFELKGRL